MILGENHKDLMRRVFGTDNLQAIYDEGDSAPDDYIKKLIPYICGTKGVPEDSDLAEDIIDALHELDEQESDYE